MFSLGGQNISDIYVGENKISEAYLGNELVYRASKPLKQVGDIVEWAGYTWIVVNDNGDGTIVLASSEIYEITKFGSNNIYLGSILAERAKAFEDLLPDESLEQAVETTVEGVTGNVFVPTREQAGGGFEYFISNDSRICQYNGANMAWWLSSLPINSTAATTGSAVKNNGELINANIITREYGFRPFVTVKQF